MDRVRTPSRTKGIERTSLLPRPSDSKPSVLVALASYGTKQDEYLARVIAEYRRLPMQPRVIVLSNLTKPVATAEVVVGLPSRNPYSLPFAHRKVFAECADQHDLFIYSEDDTLISESQVRAFLELQSHLEEEEILGFLRCESDAQGRRFVTSIHHHFRWRPERVIERGGEVFAELSNHHSGCFMVTQKQLKKAIASGGFLVPPHSERYGMLETAASDIYTQCGLRRLISLSRIHDFIVPHLPNKYYSRMGIPAEDLECQVRALCALRENGGWIGRLFEPGTEAPDFRWSKNLYERPDTQLLSAIPATARSVLSAGCGWGENELWLHRKGIATCAIPIDAIFGAALKRRGIRASVGPLESAIGGLGSERFDVVLLADVLHLVEDPVDWLRRLSTVLTPGGRIVGSVANTGDLSLRFRDWREGRTAAAGSFNGKPKHDVTTGRLRSWCRSAGLRAESVIPVLDGTERGPRKWGAKVMRSWLAPRFILTAVRG